MEQRLEPVRAHLLSADFRGEIAFITKSVLAGLPPTPEDDKEWGQCQYVMIPWVLVREKRKSLRFFRMGRQFAEARTGNNIFRGRFTVIPLACFLDNRSILAVHGA